MQKLSFLDEDEWKEYSYALTYTISGNQDKCRIIAGVSDEKIEVFERLATCLQPPYFLLYVLHTPRVEGKEGRYQSPAISVKDFSLFMAHFGNYLKSDGRFDIWIHSPSDNATVVWDRHNLIFAYGPIKQYEHELHSLGYTEGTCEVPGPHQHHYRQECDKDALELLSVRNSTTDKSTGSMVEDLSRHSNDYVVVWLYSCLRASSH
jgi:hypothetical protein